MSTYASNAMPAPVYGRQSLMAGTEPSSMPHVDAWQRSPHTLRDPANRFDVVEGGRRDANTASPLVPFAAARPASWSPVSAPHQAAVVEQYRRLAAALLHANVERGVKVVMIASSVGGEGKSLTAANLAVTLARSYGRQTLLVDADLRSPRLHEIFHEANTSGLGDWLRCGGAAGAATVQLLPGLTLLTAGRPTGDPMAGLTSAGMRALMKIASDAYDFVVVDTPPATLVPDAGILADLVDAAVLVIRANSTPHAVIERAIATIGRERILGTVLNRADKMSVGRYGYGYPGK